MTNGVPTLVADAVRGGGSTVLFDAFPESFRAPFLELPDGPDEDDSDVCIIVDRLDPERGEPHASGEVFLFGGRDSAPGTFYGWRNDSAGASTPILAMIVGVVFPGEPMHPCVLVMERTGADFVPIGPPRRLTPKTRRTPRLRLVREPSS